MAAEEERNPAEQLVEFLLYAPIGLLYEYEDVAETLIKRGKSQVQLAKLLGQVAVNRSNESRPEQAVGDAGSMLVSLVAKALTEFGTKVGLAPDGPTEATATPSAPTQPATPTQSAAESDEGEVAVETADDAPEPAAADSRSVSLPIAGYDKLTAREIVGLLDELTDVERGRIREHEVAGRNRKTVLAKLDRLDR